MAFTYSVELPWSASDRTKLLNDQSRGHILKGIFTGGEIAPVPASLQVTITDFEAKSYDGMTVRVTDGPETVAIADGVVNHVVLEARHNEGGAPTLSLQVLDAAAYAAHGQLPYLILLGTVDLTVGGPHIDAQTTDISYVTRDELDIRQRVQYRGMVADQLALTALTVDPHHLRPGDIWGYLSPRVSYWQWNTSGTAFEPLNMQQYSVIAQQYEMLAESQRRIFHSGVIGSGFPNHIEPSDDLPIWPVDKVTGARLSSSDAIMVGGLSVLINGHFLQTYNTKLEVGVANELSAIPGANDIWDGIMLEVYRADFADPASESFVKGGGFTWSLANIRSEMAFMDRDPTDYPGVVGGMYEKTNLGYEADGTSTNFVYRFVVYQDIMAGPAAPDLITPCDTFTGQLNVDGNAWERMTAFGQPVGEANADVESMYRAVNSLSSDGVSWGMPIAMIRRVLTEANPNEIFDGNRTDDLKRQIFPVAPIIKTERAHRHIQHAKLNADIITDYVEAAHKGFSRWRDAMFVPSGILVGAKLPFDHGAGANLLRVPEMEVSILGQKLRVAQTDVDLAAAPGVSKRRDLVVLEMRIVRHHSADEVPSGYGQIVMPELTDDDGNMFRIALRYVVTDVGTDIEVEAAMATAGFSDMSIVFADGEKIEPGLWVKVFGADNDFEQPFPGSGRYALPIALVHRRNTTNFDASTNPNGSYNGGLGIRPDLREDNLIYQEDIADLRQQVLLDRGRLQSILDESYNALLAGRLRTKMSTHPSRADVAGVQHLHQDAVSWEWSGVDGTDRPAGFTDMCDNGGAISGARSIWSYADQNQPMNVFISGALVAGNAYDLGGYNRLAAQRHVVINISVATIAAVDVVAPEGAVFVLEDDGVGGWQPYIRLTELTGPNTAVGGGAVANIVVAGSLSNVTAFTFDTNDTFKTSSNPRMMEFLLVFKGLGPTTFNLVEVSRGLSAAPDVLLSAGARVTDRATELINSDLVLDVAPPMRRHSVAVSGAGNDEFDFDLTLTDPGAESPLAVGLNLFRWGTGNYVTGQSSTGVAKSYEEYQQQQRERSTMSTFVVANNPHRIEPDAIGNTLFGAAPGSRVTCNAAFNVMRVKTAVPLVGTTAQLYMAHRNSGDNRKWVEVDKGSQTYMGNFVWGTWHITTVGNTYVIYAAEFADGAGSTLSPQSMFWHGCLPMLDIFIWRNTGGGGNIEWELIPNRTQEGASIWETLLINQAGAPAYTQVTFLGAQDGYDLTGGGHDIKIVARILEPPIYDNHWNSAGTASAYDKTVWQHASYLATPYQGAVSASSRLSRTMHGEVAAVSDHVTVTSAARPPQLAAADNSTAALSNPIRLQNTSAYSMINPAEVFKAVLGSFNFADYPNGYGAMSSQLPVVEEFHRAGAAGLLPNDASSLKDFYRLLKHTYGPLLDIPGHGHGVLFAIPVGHFGALFDADVGTLKPGVVLTDIAKANGAAADIGVIFEPAASSSPFLGPRGAFVAHWDQGSGLDTRRIKGGVVNFAPRGEFEYRELISARGLDVDITSTRVKAYAVNAKLDVQLASSPSQWSHVIIGDEIQGGGLQGIPLWTAYAYLLLGTGPVSSDRGNAMMIVTTKLSTNSAPMQGGDTASSSGYGADRLPGEAFDAFYPIGRPILRFRGE